MCAQLLRAFSRLDREERAQTMAEYAVTLSIITAVIIAAIGALSSKEESLFQQAINMWP